MRAHVLIRAMPLLLAFATTAAEPPPRRSRPPAVISPEIHSDLRVTFRLRATNASEVVVSGQWAGERTPMKRGENGVWNATVGPVAPGVYEYSFIVDGLSMIDPGNPAIKPMRQPRTSILHVAGDPPRIHDFQRVPHGVVRHHTYFSDALNRPRDMVVYTPPGYDKDTTAKYPALYLFHGSGDNHATWTVHGKAHWILDNLIAQERARPMLIVMLDGHASPERRNNSAAFERDLMEEVLPFINSHYRVLPDAANRAIAGLSMGGEQSLRIGLNHLDTFSWIAGFSAAAPSRESIEDVLAEPAAANQRIKLLWIACGKEDFLLQRNQEFIETLKSCGLDHEWHLTDGPHSWPVWRGYLADLCPRLFIR
jgi:enterochelin esterase family protein